MKVKPLPDKGTTRDLRYVRPSGYAGHKALEVGDIIAPASKCCDPMTMAWSFVPTNWVGQLYQPSKHMRVVVSPFTATVLISQ